MFLQCSLSLKNTIAHNFKYAFSKQYSLRFTLTISVYLQSKLVINSINHLKFCPVRFKFISAGFENWDTWDSVWNGFVNLGQWESEVIIFLKNVMFSRHAKLA